MRLSPLHVLFDSVGVPDGVLLVLLWEIVVQVINMAEA